MRARVRVCAQEMLGVLECVRVYMCVSVERRGEGGGLVRAHIHAVLGVYTNVCACGMVCVCVCGCVCVCVCVCVHVLVLVCVWGGGGGGVRESVRSCARALQI